VGWILIKQEVAGSTPRQYKHLCACVCLYYFLCMYLQNKYYLCRRLAGLATFMAFFNGMFWFWHYVFDIVFDTVCCYTPFLAVVFSNTHNLSHFILKVSFIQGAYHDLLEHYYFNITLHFRTTTVITFRMFISVVWYPYTISYV
jgi:hypothetical protein